jgi:hypothetical protein
MTIAQTLTTSFKVEILEGIHDLLNDTIKVALYTASASLDATTTTYTSTYEVSGTGYTSGGLVMTGVTVTSSGTTAIVDFADAVWSGASFTARGALIYNASKANRAVAVLDFGADKTASNSTFTVQMPAPTASTALIRIV